MRVVYSGLVFKAIDNKGKEILNNMKEQNSYDLAKIAENMEHIRFARKDNGGV